jgi:predicted flap endonuclease-1-like 5' DNA nuclease
MVAVLSLVAIVLVWLLLLAGVEPVPTWFYVFVWYPTLVFLDASTSRRVGGVSIFVRPKVIAPLLAWSAVIWLLFEAANFRLFNWYYVFLPSHPVERWVGILLSFATVVPAVLLAARLFDAAWDGPTTRRRLTVRAWQLRAATATGVGAAVLSMAFPRLFFPLVWGAVWLAVDPWLYRRRPEWSLIGDLERGDWSRVTRLLAGGVVVGFLWEFYNYWALGKWIYTVPWLEELKLFEMPPFGFVGFPIFALEAWTLYHVVCALGLAQPVDVVSKRAEVGAGNTRPVVARRRAAGVVVVAVLFSVATLLGMERFTISSTVPELRHVPGLPATVAKALADANLESPFRVAELSASDFARTSGSSPADATRALNVIRLTLLRGIGTVHAERLMEIGITAVCELSRADPSMTWQRVRSGDRIRPTRAEVREWVRAAKRRCEAGP